MKAAPRLTFWGAPAMLLTASIDAIYGSGP
jgi:hypothetical protein